MPVIFAAKVSRTLIHKLDVMHITNVHITVKSQGVVNVVVPRFVHINDDDQLVKFVVGPRYVSIIDDVQNVKNVVVRRFVNITG